MPQNKKECPQCKKLYSANYMKDHMISHNENHQNFSCDICGLSYINKSTLKVHMALHKGLTFYCDLCPSTFRTSAILKNHRQRHFFTEDEERTFKCQEPGCSSAYFTNSGLWCHKKTHIKTLNNEKEIKSIREYSIAPQPELHSDSEEEDTNYPDVHTRMSNFSFQKQENIFKKFDVQVSQPEKDDLNGVSEGKFFDQTFLEKLEKMYEKASDVLNKQRFFKALLDHRISRENLGTNQKHTRLNESLKTKQVHKTPDPFASSEIYENDENWVIYKRIEVVDVNDFHHEMAIEIKNELIDPVTHVDLVVPSDPVDLLASVNPIDPVNPNKLNASEYISCHDCQKMILRTNIERHKRDLHKPRDRRFKCPEPDCSMRFYDRYRLKSHKISHSDKKNFKCKFCLEAFRYQNSLKNHMLRIHNKVLQKKKRTKKEQ